MTATEFRLLAALQALCDTSVKLGMCRGIDDKDAFLAALNAHLAALQQGRAVIAECQGEQQ